MKEALSDAQTAGSSSSSDPDSTDNSQTDRYIPPTRTQSYTGTGRRKHIGRFSCLFSVYAIGPSNQKFSPLTALQPCVDS